MSSGVSPESRGPLTPDPPMTSGRVRLLIAFALFAGWLAWLGYAALTKSHDPVVSRAQAAGAAGEKGAAVVARIKEGGDQKPAKKVELVTTLSAGGTKPPAEFEVANLPDTQGFDGAGEYLLFLVPARGGDEFRVVGRPPSPGYSDLPAAGKPAIYRWTPAVESQVKNLLP